MGVAAPESMKLSDFMADSLVRTSDQIRESTRHECESAMKQFIAIIGNIDYQRGLPSDTPSYFGKLAWMKATVQLQ